MKTKAIIFDVDGVVFKTHDEYGRWLWSRTITEDLGLTSEHFSAIFSEKWDAIIRGKIDLNAHLQAIFEEELFKDLIVTPDEYLRYWLSHDHHVDQAMVSLVGNLECPSFLGTNQEALRTRHIWHTVGSYFEGCFASYEIGFIKPEREFFQHIQKVLSIPPHELLLIDDTKNNIESAQKCGWHVYHYQNDIEALIAFLKNYEAANG